MRDFAERFLHIDMDAFFVEVERKRDPSLQGVPVIVGGLGRRGVVASASYEARAVGVHSAMPIGEARRLCPRARFVPPDHNAYGEVSRQVFVVFRDFTPMVEGLSVDEAFLDIAGLRLHYQSPAAAGDELRSRVRREVGLPASVGISAVKFVSKLASDAAKPDGLLVVATGSELSFLHPMPVRRLWGVGQATRASLEALAIETIGDLAVVPKTVLVSRLGPSLAEHLSQLANGIDDRQVEAGGGAKSVSVEETYATDLDTDAAIDQALLRLCDRLSSRLRRAGYAGHTVVLKIRFGDFETLTRSMTVADPVERTPALRDASRGLLDRIDRAGRGVRLLGVGVSSLDDAATPRQLSLDSQARNV
ncbi:MAG: DNA polymerase IV, partial [Acidimicrobiia bacterium]|nr:DNA polymerase IV [Acidimicrobiia bacterium]